MRRSSATALIGLCCAAALLVGCSTEGADPAAPPEPSGESAAEPRLSSEQLVEEFESRGLHVVAGFSGGGEGAGSALTDGHDASSLEVYAGCIASDTSAAVSMMLEVGHAGEAEVQCTETGEPELRLTGIDETPGGNARFSIESARALDVAEWAVLIVAQGESG